MSINKITSKNPRRPMETMTSRQCLVKISSVIVLFIINICSTEAFQNTVHSNGGFVSQRSASSIISSGRRQIILYGSKKPSKKRRRETNGQSKATSFGSGFGKPKGPEMEKMGKHYMEQATMRLLDEEAFPAGSLEMGKWHEIKSMMVAWSKTSKSMSPSSYKIENTPLIIEGLLKRLIDEKAAGNKNVKITTDIYNIAISAWGDTAAVASSHPGQIISDKVSSDVYRASARRAQEIVKHMQSLYLADPEHNVKPDDDSYLSALRAWTKACASYAKLGQKKRALEAAAAAKEFLEWIVDSSSNENDNNSIVQDPLAYSLVMDAYAKSGAYDAGSNAEQILRTLIENGGRPNTFAYNIVINAYTQQQRKAGAINHAERILNEMEHLYVNDKNQDVQPDVVSYTSVVSAWANGNRKAYGAKRAHDILNRMDQMGVQPNTITYNAVLKAWCRSGDKNASKQARSIFSKMESLHSQDNKHVKPDRITLNTFMHTLSKSGRREEAEYAEEILTRMEQLEAEGKSDYSPNLFSYNTVMEGWSKARDSERTIAVLRRLLENQNVQPDSYSFNCVIFAISRSNRPNAPTRAQELLEYMENLSTKGERFSQVRSDVFGYSSAIHAWSRSSRHDAGYKAELLLQKMEEKYESGEEHLKPNTVTFNSVMDAWAKSSGGTLGARKAEALLEKMHQQYRAGDTHVQPNVMSYNTVLSAWARSGTKCAYRKTEAILDNMWKEYEAGNVSVRPDSSSYNTVINAISKSQAEGKAQKALRILRKMDKLYRAGRNKDACPNEFSYTSVLNSCAYATELDDRGRSRALDTAIFTLKELTKSHYGNPNHITYGTFLRACDNLLSLDDERRRVVVEPVFLQCCQDGQVCQFVLTHLRNAAPDDLYQKLLGEFIVTSGGKVSIQDLPAEWKCNVVERFKNKRGSERMYHKSSRSPVARAANTRRNNRKSRVPERLNKPFERNL